MEIHSTPIRMTLGPVAELDRLGDQIAELSAHLEAASARLLDLIREFDARGGWGNGFRSCADWLGWRVGLDLGTAREKVRVARALGTLPLLAQALARGELSYAKVRALTRVATPETEARLLGVGRGGAAAHVERIVRGWRCIDRKAEARATKRQHASRALHVHQDEDGTVVLRGRLEPEVGALFMKALAAARETHLEKSRELTQREIRSAATLPFVFMADCATSRAWLACNLVELGEFDAAIRVAEEAVQIAESAQHRHVLARFAVSWVRLRRGEWTSIIPELEEGLVRCRSVNNVNMTTPYSAALGQAYTLARRSADAVAVLEDTVIRVETENRANRALWLSFLSDAYLLAGRLSDAAKTARRGFEGARARQERGEEAWNLRALAEALCADASDVNGAEGHYRAALALAEGLGMRPLVARCHAGLANLYRRTGRHRQARELLTTAMTMYREMGMRFWLNEAEAEMKPLE